MPVRFFDPETIASPMNPYSHGAEVEAGSKLLYMAGQVGRRGPNREILPDFEDQVRQTYANIQEILKESDMDLTNLVKMTTYLTDRKNLEEMREIRKEILGGHKPAHTLIIAAGLAYEEYMIEVECIAAA